MEFTTISGFFVSELEMANNPADAVCSVPPEKPYGLRLGWTDLQAVLNRKGLRDRVHRRAPVRKRIDGNTVDCSRHLVTAYTAQARSA